MFRSTPRCVLVGLVLARALALPVHAGAEEEAPPHPSFNQGPDAVEARLESDARKKEPWFDTSLFEPFSELKESLHNKIGLSIGTDYSMQYFHAVDSLEDDDVAAGMIRLYGAWDLIDRDGSYPGRMIFKGEHRHEYSSQTPGELSFDVGNIGAVGPPFKNDGFRLTNLFWRQGIKDDRVVLQAGLLDVTDYLDVYAMASPWLAFANLAFSTGSSSIPLPGEASLGIVAGGWLTSSVYVVGGMADANADPTDPFQDSFFDDHEYFKHAEIGWTSSRGNQYRDNVHLTFWHVDERDTAAVNDGWGINFSAAWWIGEAWLPFLRAGFAEDGGSLLEKSVSVGIGHQPPGARDVFGLAFNWGEPNSDTFGSGLDDQFAIEGFWRIQLLQHFALTPSIQWLGNPALNPGDDSVWLFGLRARFEL